MQLQQGREARLQRAEVAPPVTRGGEQALRFPGALTDALQGAVHAIERCAIGQDGGKARGLRRRAADGDKGRAVCGNGLCLSEAEVRQRLGVPLLPFPGEQVVCTEIKHDARVAPRPRRKLRKGVAGARVAIADSVDAAMQVDRMRHCFWKMAEVAAAHNVAEHGAGRVGRAPFGNVEMGEEIHGLPASGRSSLPRPGMRPIG